MPKHTVTRWAAVKGDVILTSTMSGNEGQSMQLAAKCNAFPDSGWRVVPVAVSWDK